MARTSSGGDGVTIPARLFSSPTETKDKKSRLPVSGSRLQVPASKETTASSLIDYLLHRLRPKETQATDGNSPLAIRETPASIF